MVRTTKSSLNSPCTPSSTATTRAWTGFGKEYATDLCGSAKDAKMGSKLSAEELAAFKHAKADAIVAPVKGQVFWEFQGEGECAPAVEPYIGKEYKEGDTFCYPVPFGASLWRS